MRFYRFNHIKHSHKKRKDNLKARAVLLIFMFELEISGVPYRVYNKTANNGGCCEELLSENDF